MIVRKEMNSDSQNNEYQQITNRVSVVSVLVNLGLSLFKAAAGILGHSSAMISDAVHSASDILGSLIVVVGAHFSEREADKNHPYGHERFESVSSVLLAFILVMAGFSIAGAAFETLRTGAYRHASAPGRIALAAAVISIVFKEAMYWYTIHYARIIRSGSLKAEAWHHRSDALSSVGSLIGIAGARMGFPALDPAAGLVISLFILKAAADIFREAVDRMTDHACDSAFEEEIRQCVLSCPGVQGIDLLQTREFGRKAYVDLEVRMDGHMELARAHQCAEEIHRTLEERFPLVKHVMVHVNPC